MDYRFLHVHSVKFLCFMNRELSTKILVLCICMVIRCVCLLYAGAVRGPPDPHSRLHTATPHGGGGETSACPGTEPDEGRVF